MLPPALEGFSRLPFWNILFLLLAAAIVAYSGRSLIRRRHRQDLYYLLLGVYLMLFLMPEAFPSLGRAIGFDLLHAGFSQRFGLALPAITLFVLGVRAR